MTLANRVALITACGLAATLQVPLAHAQNAGAEALFREGRILIKQGQLGLGCDKLAASDKIESSVGTLLNLGDCREKLGKVASAWAAFRKAEAMAKRAGDDTKRQVEARKRAEMLEPSLPNLVVQVGPSSKNTAGIVIKRDGEPLDATVFNMPVPIDPGAHTIIAEAPGHKPFKTEVSVGKGGKRYVVIPSLERIPEPVAAPIVVTPAPVSSMVVEREPAVAQRITVRDTWSGTRKAAVGIATVGAIALGTGIYFGSRANDLQAQSDAICPGLVCADPAGLRLNDDAKSTARTANILFLAGGAAVATATVLWFVGKPEERTVVAPTLGSDHVGAALVGRF